MIIMVSVGIASALVQMILYVVHNRCVAQGKHQPKNGLAPMVFIPWAEGTCLIYIKPFRCDWSNL